MDSPPPSSSATKATKAPEWSHPSKKPIGGELSDNDHEYNKQLNKLRAVVERAIAHLKNWKILHTDYRRPVFTFKQTITVAIGLYFFSTTE